MLVFHRRQLKTVLSDFIAHYNQHRPLGHQAPLAAEKKPLQISDPDPTQLRWIDRLGGLVHQYRLVA
jgi:hypothetical protein